MEISQEELSKIISQAVTAATTEVNKKKVEDEEDDFTEYKPSTTDEYISYLESELEFYQELAEQNRQNKNRAECERDAALSILKQINNKYGIVKNGGGKLYHSELIKEVPVPYPVKETCKPLIIFKKGYNEND